MLPNTENPNVGSRSFSTLALALVLFALASSVVALLVPRLFIGGVRPGFAIFLVSGVTTIILTAALFAYVGRLGMGFGKTALALAAGYNALIATVKLALAPAALYEANQEQSFDTTAGDPNSPWFYLVVGLTVLVLYAVFFSVMYRFFKRRFRRRMSRVDSASARQSGAPNVIRSHPWAVLVIVAVVVLLGLGVWWVPVFFVALPTLSYLSYVFSTLGVAIVLALGMAAFLAFRTFDEVEKRAVRLGDATLLASFFWFGFALIVLYHVMWAVFLLALVSIWPFQTYTPK